MSERVLVLGATGRFGQVAAGAFRAAGWMVTSQVRPGTAHRAPPGTEIIEADALDQKAVVAAARDADVVLHALNPIYTDWVRFALPLAYGAIAAAEASGATLLFPGNVYNYGAGMPAMLDETTPMHPTSRKGQLRVMIEERIEEACERGMRAIILRAGDFFGSGRGAWLDLVIAKDLSAKQPGRGVVTYPGPLDLVHEWAYVPDLAEAAVRLAAKRAELAPRACFGFSGHAVTGNEFVAAIAKAARRDIKVKRMGWWLVAALGPFLPLCRELSEMSYLWQVPHRIDGSRLAATIGQIPHTPLDRALAAALRDLGAIA